MFGKIKEYLKVDELIAGITEYVEAKIELAKIEAKETISKVVGELAVHLLTGVLLGFGAFLLTIAAGLGIGQLLDNYALGFLIIALVWAIPGVILLNTGIKKSLSTTIRNKVWESMQQPSANAQKPNEQNTTPNNPNQPLNF